MVRGRRTDGIKCIICKYICAGIGRRERGTTYIHWKVARIACILFDVVDVIRLITDGDSGTVL